MKRLGYDILMIFSLSIAPFAFSVLIAVVGLVLFGAWWELLFFTSLVEVAYAGGYTTGHEYFPLTALTALLVIASSYLRTKLRK